MNDFRHLDQQLSQWEARLVSDLGIEAADARVLGSAVSRDVSALDAQTRLNLREGQPVKLSDRIQELIAFQAFMDSTSDMLKHRAAPGVNRAQVVVQNYVCFVYLGESCFRELRRALPPCTTKRCCAFLTDNPVRAFRNAIAHANWRYAADFSGLDFWARRGSTLEEPVVQWHVSQSELNLWQALARCTAYAAYTSL